MRARLLDATVDCLVAGGYAKLSTNDVVRRAGVSRGALAHHFPTKSELVAAAGTRLIERRAAEFRATFRAVPAASARSPKHSTCCGRTTKARRSPPCSS